MEQTKKPFVCVTWISSKVYAVEQDGQVNPSSLVETTFEPVFCYFDTKEEAVLKNREIVKDIGAKYVSENGSE